MEADAIFGNLVVYVPDGRDFFAIEPVSHSSDAINRPDLARNELAVLRPGETMSGVVRLRVGAPGPLPGPSHSNSVRNSENLPCAAEEQVLYFVDIKGRALHRFDPATGRVVTWPMPEDIGCIGLCQRSR